MSKLHVTVRSISDSPVIRYYVYNYFNKILKFHPKIQSCKVVVDAEQKNRNRLKIYSVSVDLTIPKRELVSKKYNTNLFLAIRQAFQAVEKSLIKCNKRKVDYLSKCNRYRVAHRPLENNMADHI